jgi:hypothetical protein
MIVGISDILIHSPTAAWPQNPRLDLKYTRTRPWHYERDDLRFTI